MTMSAKTFCRPGSFFEVVPIGLQVTLQYSSKGLLEKVFIGYDAIKSESGKELLSSIREHKLVPLSIQTKGGTTWVEGVFYTDTVINESGLSPYCNNSKMIEGIILGTLQVSFYAGRVESLAASFHGANIIRNWLQMNNFNVLPGHLMPAGLNRDGIMNMIYGSSYPFTRKMISGYTVFDVKDTYYVPSNNKQKLVKKVSKFRDTNGYIRARIQTDDGEITVSYSDVVKYNINANTLIYLDVNGTIIYSELTDDKKRDKRTNKLTCDVCGKPFHVSLTGPVTCSDAHCPSRLYPQICRMLSVFELPGMSEGRFEEVIKCKYVTTLTDVLLLPEYHDLHLKLTLAKVLEGCIPADVCANKSTFTLLANSCNNSVKTLDYYLQNPDKIATELSVANLFVSNIMNWLKDGENVLTLQTLLYSSQIELTDVVKKFDGAPIFRGQYILVTGDFYHGQLSEIVSIISSYDANVVTEYCPEVKFAVVGGHRSNIDGKSLNDCKLAGVRVWEELEFFNHFGIDEDLKTNLL